ncbi:sensor histidine kinase KdpD, partial [Pseudomonas poae]|uniref:sensor histidine kinase n=1 Tax=Pseudomonas poae TaxID=200451 RepID=UPI00223AE844
LLGSEILKDSQGLEARAAKVATQIHTSVTRANQIVGDLLDLTRCHMGPGIPVNKTDLDLLPVCRRVVDEVQAFHPEANVLFVAPTPVAGKFDGPRLEQVFSNIISNAVNHGNIHFPITVQLSVTGDVAVFSVHNSGEPIPEDVLPFIFNPMGRFSQRSATESGPTEGLGLGLFIASEIVTSHKGSIDVTSDSKQGTTFLVKLPLTE